MCSVRESAQASLALAVSKLKWVHLHSCQHATAHPSGNHTASLHMPRVPALLTLEYTSYATLVSLPRTGAVDRSA